MLPIRPSRTGQRDRGQFWTPDWVARAMAAYVLGGGADRVFDPAVGAGALLRAARDVASTAGRFVRLLGTEIDPGVLPEAWKAGLTAAAGGKVEVRDFLLNPPAGPFPAIIANPPYIRHHRLPPRIKARLRAEAQAVIGHPLDGRAGAHVYFLIKALRRLDPKCGRLAFILPADVCEGVYAPVLWRWITRRFRLDGVITFHPEASPFPGVDTNPVIVLIRAGGPTPTAFWWVRCRRPESASLEAWVRSGCGVAAPPDLDVHRRALAEAMALGLSRPPVRAPAGDITLGHLARVKRGIATGANEFFFLTRQRARALGIPDELLVLAIGRTRDLPGDVVTDALLAELDARGRPTRLFVPDARPVGHYPAPVRAYLKHGEQAGLPGRPLIASRRPWYRMEVRTPPPILFAYLGRRSARFILNHASVVPLTGFLCVYPRRSSQAFARRLWTVLRHPATVGNLALVGKSYGAGCLKVEPRALERLPLPAHVLEECGLDRQYAEEQRVRPLA